MRHCEKASDVARIAASLLAVAACAPTHVETTQSYAGAALPRPAVIVVNEFAVTPDEVTLDRGLSARLKQAFGGASPQAQELATGRKVAATIAKTLVAEIGKLGLPAAPGGGATAAAGGNALIVDGQLLAVDEGNRTRRNLIGLGAGKSTVEAEAQLYYATASGPRRIESFAATAQSGRKPGAAETMGVGAATDRAAEVATTNAGASVASETLSADVEADAERMGKEIAKKLAAFFADQGWIAAPAR